MGQVQDPPLAPTLAGRDVYSPPKEEVGIELTDHHDLQADRLDTIHPLIGVYAILVLAQKGTREAGKMPKLV